MNLEDGKKYNTIGAGVGTAKRHPEWDDVTALFFDDEHPDKPIYYYAADEGRSNISNFITTKYDVTGEYTEQE